MSRENRSYHHGPKTRNKIKNPDLTFSNSTISASSYVRNLGVTIASSFSMKPHSSFMLTTKQLYVKRAIITSNGFAVFDSSLP